jgi:hypothetical protein
MDYFCPSIEADQMADHHDKQRWPGQSQSSGGIGQQILPNMDSAMIEDKHSSLSQSKSGQSHPEGHYIEIDSSVFLDDSRLTKQEVMQIRRLLNSNNLKQAIVASASTDANSEYSEFPETTHAWAVFADKPQRNATKTDRCVGTVIIMFQLFTYALFVLEAIEDYEKGVVPILISHGNCQAQNENPIDNFACEAEFTSNFDALVAFSMLSIFLTPEILQATRAVYAAPPMSQTMVFALLAAVEVLFAYVAATVAISYELYIGEVTDAIEVGVGLLFIRELSARAYHGIRHKGVKQYKTFALVVSSLILTAFVVELLCEATLSPQRLQYDN